MREEEDNKMRELVASCARKLEPVVEARGLLADLLSAQTDFCFLPDQAWPTLCLAPLVTHAVPKVEALGTQYLQDQWGKRQTGLVAEPRNNAIRSSRYKPCLFGSCVCRGGFITTALARFIAIMKTLPNDQFLAGRYIVTWQGSVIEEPTSVGDVSHGQRLPLEPLHTHVSLAQLRPWRCTFLQVIKDDSQPEVERFFPELQEDGSPKLLSLYEWMYELRSDMAWDVEVTILSTRHTPVGRVAGVAYASPLDKVLEARSIWNGDRYEELMRKKKRGRKKPLHERLGRASGVLARSEDTGTEVANSHDLPPLAEQNGDDVEEHELLFLERIAEFEHDDDVEQEGLASAVAALDADQAPTRSSSSSSSSRSSSSSSSSSSDGLLAANAGPAQRREVESQRPEPAQPPEAESQRPETSRTVHAGTHNWGPFRLTYRKPSASQRPAWQATCLYHAKYAGDRVQTRCTRSIVLQRDEPSSQEAQDKLRTLYTWLLAGRDCNGKRAHQQLPAETLSEEQLRAALAQLPAPPEKPAETDSSDGEAVSRPKRQRRSA